MVLGSGGVRAAAYSAALRLLNQERKIISISGNSAGAAIAALFAAGLSPDEIDKHVALLTPKRLMRGRRFLGPLFWPFSQYRENLIGEVFDEAVGPGFTFGKTKLPLAMSGVDLNSNRFLAYSSVTHPDMQISDGLRIATALPGLLPAVEDDGRLLVDAAIATACPLWLASLFPDQSAPIVAITLEGSTEVVRPRGFPEFLTRVITGGVMSTDEIQFQLSTRTVRVRIRTSIAEAKYGLDQLERTHLKDAGEQAMRDALAIGLRRKVSSKSPETRRTPQDAARAAAKESMSVFAREVHMSNITINNSPGAVLAVGSRLTNVKTMIQQAAQADPQLAPLFDELEKLRAQLEADAAEHERESALVAKRLEELTQTLADSRASKAERTVSKEGLLSAAKAVESVLPVAWGIVQRIMGLIAI